MEKLKLSLLQKWEIPQKYSFVHSSGVLSDGRVLILTNETDDSDKYCVLVLSSSGLKEVEVCDSSFEEERQWITYLHDKNIPTVFVLNKSDIVDSSNLALVIGQFETRRQKRRCERKVHRFRLCHHDTSV